MKHTLLLITLFVSAILCEAQVKIGLQGGTSFANQSTEYIDPADHSSHRHTSHSDFGLLGGVVAEIPLLSNFSLRPQLNVLQKNFTYSFVGERSHLYELDYFQLPVDIVYNCRYCI